MPNTVGGIGGIFEELISPTKRPQVPAAPYVNPQAAQLRTITGNQQALTPLEQLASGVNTFNLGQRQQMVNTAIPGASGLIQTASGNLNDWLHGVIPSDVTASVARSGAARGIESGTPGSPFNANLVARDLGLTSLQLEQGATAALPGYLGGMANLLIPDQFNPASMFLTPGQDMTAEQWNEINRYRQQAVTNEIAAMPDPLFAAVGQAVGSNLNQDLGMAKSFFTGGGGMNLFSGGGGGAPSPAAGSETDRMLQSFFNTG